MVTLAMLESVLYALLLVFRCVSKTQYGMSTFENTDPNLYLQFSCKHFKGDVFFLQTF